MFILSCSFLKVVSNLAIAHPRYMHAAFKHHQRSTNHESQSQRIRLMNCDNFKCMTFLCSHNNLGILRNYSTSNTSSQGSEKKNETETSKDEKKTLQLKDKLKIAVRDYGSTVIVFHIGHSLTLLGIIYLVLSSGIDVKWLLLKIGVGESNVAAGAGTFVAAYAVNKVLAPLRISITLSATPFIVRYLRKLGFLKPPSSS